MFFDPYKAEDMKNAMRTMATDATVSERLVDNGYERVKFFSWDKMTKKVLEVYKSING